MPSVLPKLATELRRDKNLDVLMYDNMTITIPSGEIISNCDYPNQSTEEMSGSLFLQTQGIPWVPWLYALRRRFLLEQHIAFAESVRFEDTDYSLHCIAKAKRVRFIPLVVLVHTCHAGQTTQVNNDVEKIIDMFKPLTRIKKIAQEAGIEDPACEEAIMGHYRYIFRVNVTRILWRIPAKDIINILHIYRPSLPQPDWFMRLCATHPMLVAFLLIIAKPWLPLARKVYITFIRKHS